MGAYMPSMPLLRYYHACGIPGLGYGMRESQGLECLPSLYAYDRSPGLLRGCGRDDIQACTIDRDVDVVARNPHYGR